jgi:hypothetical protein
MNNVLKILPCAIKRFTTVMNNVKRMKRNWNVRKKEHNEKGM